MDVLGTPRPAREVREPGLTVGLTLALILTLLLVVLVTALSLFIAWRRHKRQRARRFRHYKFNVESKLDVMYDPGVLKLDATFTVHSSVGSIFHELTYEREMCSYSPTPHTPVVKDETRIKNKAAEGDDAGAADTDVAHAEKKNEGDEESNSSSLESGKGTNSESPRQSFLVNAASGGDDNSCPLSPSSIALELGTNDSNSSSGRSRAASLRQSCGDARSTVGYVSETTNGLSHTTGSGGGATITSNQWEIPVFEDLTWQPSPANVDSGVEFRATGYVSEPNELRVTSTFSGGPATPLPTGKEDCQMGTSGHRNLWSRYTSDSSGGVGCPSGYVTRETTMTVREREQQPAQQPAHPPGKQMTHETSAERTRRQQQQHRIEHQECSEQHNIQQKQHQIEQQQQQRQQNQQQARIERAVSSLSLNIITDLEQAFPLASRFASYESLYLSESLPQLMPTKPDFPPLGLGSTTAEGREEEQVLDTWTITSALLFLSNLTPTHLLTRTHCSTDHQ
ncbi:hypothetical protein GBAR_LOCUS29282 [Geodia barretti]|uniref:Uncharacterized protein n=2 Tax=Geodia barretti TaxID=519541 RepID=A0AA35TSE3_GEOBA|nr:hypothetical protein GBAR_LOCUS29282 [Geodia barretti]